MTALTLLEAAKLALDGGATKAAGIIALYAEKSDFLAAMPIEGIAGNALTFLQDGDLPTTAFRGVNEGYTANNGTFAPQKEALYIAGGDLDVDTFIVKTQGEATRSQHEANKIKALAVGISNQILTGDSTTDARGFDGLQKRVTASGQLIAAGATSGGDALSLKLLDQAIDAVDGATHIIMSRAMRRKFTAAFRSSSFPNGLFSMSGGSDGGQGKRFMMYNELPILVGYEQTKNTAILPFTEANPGGGAAASTSIYVVNFSTSGIHGISNGGISVRDLGELNTLPVWRTRVEWFLGMVSKSPFSASRLNGIKDADIVA